MNQTMILNQALNSSPQDIAKKIIEEIKLFELDDNNENGEFEDFNLNGNLLCWNKDANFSLELLNVGFIVNIKRKGLVFPYSDFLEVVRYFLNQDFEAIN